MVSITAVAVAVAAMVVMLSVFNGFAQFTATKIVAFEPQITVSPSSGKWIENADSLCEKLLEIPGVKTAYPAVEERAYAIGGDDARQPVRIIGVYPGDPWLASLESITIDGSATVDSLLGTSAAFVSVGVANTFRAAPYGGTAIKIYEPRRRGRITSANAHRAFRTDSVVVAGVFRTDLEEADADLMLVPLATSQRLLDLGNGASRINVSVGHGFNPERIINEINSKSAGLYRASDPLALHPEAFKMINVEKWVTLLILVFIMLLAATNLLSTMAMVITDKLPALQTLRSLGLRRGKTASVMGWIGTINALRGGAIGLIAGIALTLLQQKFGLVKLSVSDPSSIALQNYPVSLDGADVAIVGGIALLLAAVTFAASRRMAYSKLS